MSQIRLLLADRDIMFLERFSAYLQRNKANRFSIEMVTSSSKLEDWLNNGGKADLLAISSTLLFEMTKKPEIKNAVILSDCPESMLPQGYTSINKYKPAEALMKEILSLCAEKLTENPLDKGSSGKINYVIYVDGSDLLNPTAQTIACISALNRQSVFYLNLDELSNTDSYFTGNNNKGLSEMLYYVKSQKENLYLKAEACTSKDMEHGVDFMKGHKNPEDIVGLNASECESLIKSVLGRGCYDKLIISRAFQMDTLFPLLLKFADRIYISALDYRTSLDRLSRIAEILMRMDEENNLELKSRIVFCITLLDSLQRPSQSFSLPQFPTVYLPSPFDGGAGFFPPSDQYISALKSIIDEQ